MNLFNKILFLSFFLLIVLSPLRAQERLLDKAEKYLMAKNYDDAIKICKKILKKYPNEPRTYLVLTQSYYWKGEKQAALDNLFSYFLMTKDSSVAFTLGNLFLETKQYENADKFYRMALAVAKSSKDSSEIEHLLKIVDFRSKPCVNEAKSRRLPWTVNTLAMEYFPAITADNRLFFTRKQINEDIYCSVKQNGIWSQAQPLPPIVNTQFQEGAQSVTPDGKYMVFVRCITGEGCNLYEAYYRNGTWTGVQKLPAPVNSRYWDSQPCIAPDGRTLYFVSTRPGGKGKADIWVTHKIGGQWSQPQNLGDSINTPGDERSPFIHFDGKTLYFASDWWPGYGKLDIFKSTFVNGSWTTPVNLGCCYNSPQDETKFVVAPFGDMAFFSSNINGNLDIFSTELSSTARPIPVYLLTGNIVDKETGRHLEAALTLRSLEDGDSISVTGSSFLIPLNKTEDFALFCSKKGYMFYSENFSKKNFSDTNIVNITIELEPLKVNSSIVLKNIFFETDSYELKPESFGELDNLAKFLQENSGVKIAIIGHTDNSGSSEYNLTLSKKRAESVARYLYAKGIDTERIIVKGMGAKEPVASNDTEEGKQKNRRVEIKILSF